IEALRDAGVTELAVLIGWQGRRVKEYFGRGDTFGVKLSYEEQEERLGTAHAIGMARGHVSGDFLSVNGDVVFSAKAVRGLLGFHEEVKGPVMADRKSTRLNSRSRGHLVCRLLLEKKK